MDARRAQQVLTAGTWVAALLVGAAADWSRPHDVVATVALVLLVPAAALTGWIDGPITIGRMSFPVRGGELLLGVGLVLCPSGMWVLLLALGVLVGQLPGHLPRAAVARSTGLTALSGAAALAIEARLGHAVLSVLLAAALAVATAHLVTAVGVAVTVRRSVPSVLRQRGLLPVGQPLVTTLLGALVGLTLQATAVAAAVLALLVGLLVLLRRTHRRHEADLQMYAELVRGQEQAAGRSVDVSAEVVLATAARLLGGADCELLVRHPAGPVRFTGDEYGVRERLPVPASEFDRSWVLRTLGSAEVRTGTDGDRPYVAAAIGAGTPWALLAARRPAGAPAFGRADRRRLRALTGQAQTWLAVSELTGWDSPYDAGLPAGLTPTAEPSLRSLRDASRRLSRLAQQWDSTDPMSDVATEMHACQDAVTELMGAVMGRPVVRPSAGAGLVRPVEWTSTGTDADWGRG